MEHNDRNKIDRAINQLVSSVNMEILWPEIKYKIFDYDYPEISTWESNLNDSEIKKKILLDIKTRGPASYKHLVDGLEKSRQHRCVEILENNLGEVNSSEGTGSSRITVKKSTRFYDLDFNENPSGSYRMRSNPRGLVLLISLIRYNSPNEHRNAAEHDENNLKDLFEQMGFKVISESNLSAEQIRQKTQEFSQNPELQFVDSAFIIIGGHGTINITGDDSVILDVDSDPVFCDEIINYFIPENCEHLKNKPKIFIFQICRGDNEQSIASDTLYKNIPFRFKTGFGKSGIDYSDMLIAHSTLPDCVAYRDLENGSWFIEHCCKIFAEYACEYDIEDLFSLVDEKMRSCYTHSKIRGMNNITCQTPSMKICGFKKCYINPGLFENNS